MEAKIKPEDLRIGNYVKRNGIVVQVDHQTFWDIQKYPGQYKPIELAEEWLLKMGFEKLDMNDSFFVFIENFNLKISHDLEMVAWHNLMIHQFKPKYVHQLQNLFYILTGSELTINEQK